MRTLALKKTIAQQLAQNLDNLPLQGRRQLGPSWASRRGLEQRHPRHNPLCLAMAHRHLLLRFGNRPVRFYRLEGRGIPEGAAEGIGAIRSPRTAASPSSSASNAPDPASRPEGQTEPCPEHPIVNTGRSPAPTSVTSRESPPAARTRDASDIGPPLHLVRLPWYSVACLYNKERPHKGLDYCRPVEPDDPPTMEGAVMCHERLGGLLRSYYREAA